MPARHDQEQELVERARRGERDALNLLLRHTTPLALRMIGTHLRYRDDAADVLQSVLLSIWRSIRKLEEPLAYRAWVYRIIRNRVNDHLRQQYGDEVEARTQLDADLDTLPSCEDGAVFRSEIYSAMRQKIEEGINRQGDGYRTVLRLHLLEGKTYREIAAETGT